ncbi:hypothetical protein TrVE_jg9844 [Triparma verrucosa]|uniref:FAD-binding domain-containing protein n=1 Tax=Triparma verrucosa TaxID=1606542 RepID=A0A9W7KUX0_9STRA|nr:hypothetical protein TrVE_jg9844 [Triparma verrucosa]
MSSRCSVLRFPYLTKSSTRYSSIRHSSTRHSSTDSTLSHIPIAIIGSGPTGLLLSSILSRYSLPHQIYTSSPSLPSHPQAHFINTRTVEILKSAFPKIYDAVKLTMPSPSGWRYFRFGTGVGSNAQSLGTQDNFTTPSYERLRALSSVRPMNLSQDKFVGILAEAIPPSQPIKYSHKLHSITDSPSSSSKKTLTFSNGSQITASYVIGCDGSNSTVREIAGIERKELVHQNLINVHFHIKKGHMTKSILENPAMLHFVYNSSNVAVYVCHSLETDPSVWVMQIPFFPPYQSPSDFPSSKVLDLISKNFDLPASSISLISVKPWKMSSSITDRYVSGNVVLAGDAAHVFPPAGGLGMNTGLQDVHNLGWRLKTGKIEKYEEERRKIAINNDKFSVSNYNKTLNVARVLGLDNRLNDLFIDSLKGMPFLSDDAKKGMWEQGYNAALGVMKVLESQNPIVETLRKKVQRLLDAENGLPLVFPEVELGFSYGVDGPVGTVREGGRFPKLELEFRNEKVDVKDLIVRLENKMEEIWPVSVVIGEDLDGLEDAEYEGTRVMFVKVVEQEEGKEEGLEMIDGEGDFKKLLEESGLENAKAILVRPDGHVGRIYK